MNGVIFVETLRRHWRQILWWGLSIGSLAWLQTIAVPDANAIQQMAELLEALPPFMIQAFGGADAQFMATPDGYMALQFFSIILLVYAIYSVIAGLSISINEEDRGITDVLLSLPIPRTQLVVERTAAYALIILGIIALSFVGLWLGILMVPDLHVNMQRMVEGTINIVPGTLLVLTVTVLIGTVIRRRSTATALAAAFLIGSYFIDFIGRGAPDSFINDLRVVSFFAYYDGTGVIQYGLSLVNIVGLLVVTVAALGLAVFFFQRRDIGV